MEINNTKKQNTYISEEEKTLNWEDLQESFKKTFGAEVYDSWLQKISLIKEFNDYLVLGVPTRFFRDWIVSRYLDKMLEQVKSFKLSVNRIEFKIIEDSKQTEDFIKIDELNKVTEIKDSILNYNRLNPSLNFKTTIMLCLFQRSDLCIILSNQLRKMIWLILKIFLESLQFLLLMTSNLLVEKKVYKKSFFIHLTV